MVVCDKCREDNPDELKFCHNNFYFYGLRQYQFKDQLKTYEYCGVDEYFSEGYFILLPEYGYVKADECNHCSQVSDISNASPFPDIRINKRKMA